MQSFFYQFNGIFHFQFVFRLISSNGREYLLQAASEGELQLWSASIAAAIRKTESKERVNYFYL